MRKVLDFGKLVLLGCFLLFLSCKSTSERTPSILEVVDKRSFIPKEEIITFCSEYQMILIRFTGGKIIGLFMSTQVRSVT